MQERHIISVELSHEADLVVARQRARDAARLLGFGSQDQVRFATAVSELARNAWTYAGGGKLELILRGDPPQALVARVSDSGRGIEDLGRVLSGRYQSSTGMGLGLIGARRLMDEFDVRTGPAGTTVTIARHAPLTTAMKPAAQLLDELTRELSVRRPSDQLAAVREQHRELLVVLESLRAREAELEEANRQLSQANRELEDTNRGVVALYAELDARAEFARRASEVKSRFLSHLSHEFRTPLGSVLALTDMLLARLDGPLTGEQEHQVRLIRKSITTLNDLVEDLLDIARVESGREQVRASVFSTAELFNALRGMIRPLQTTDAVTIIYESEGIEELSSDEGKISQILRNLLSNALKFTDKGEIRVRAERAPNDMVRFTVSDSGIGIPAGQLQRVFEEFVQVENRHQKKHKGTGLGLPLSRKLAELLGGTLTADSVEGQGSTFTLLVPRRYDAKQAHGAQGTREGGALPSGHGRRLLVVDDDDAPRYLICTRLRAAGYEVEEARGGSEALERARHRPPDGVVLDLVMPEVSGYTVLEELKADSLTAGIPVVIYTSRPLLEEDRQRLKGAAAVVAKPDAARSDFMVDMGEALILAGLASPPAEATLG